MMMMMMISPLDSQSRPFAFRFCIQLIPFRPT